MVAESGRVLSVNGNNRTSYFFELNFELLFYILGAVCLVWCELWAIFASESPSVWSQKTQKTQGVSWTLTVFDTQIPLYLSKALGFDVASHGAASASPAVMKVLINIPWAFWGDFWVSRGCISLWTWRRINQSLSTSPQLLFLDRGSYIPMLVLIWLGFLTKQQTTLAVILLNIQAISAVKLFGSLINHVDLSPRYGGVLMGLENTLGQVIAMFAPIFNQLMVADLTDVARWRSIFLSLAAVDESTAFSVIENKKKSSKLKETPTNGSETKLTEANANKPKQSQSSKTQLLSASFC
ncbi:hypothetical protein YQE_09003, partial [Dendroctonus ponderosae]